MIYYFNFCVENNMLLFILLLILTCIIASIITRRESYENNDDEDKPKDEGANKTLPGAPTLLPLVDDLHPLHTSTNTVSNKLIKLTQNDIMNTTENLAKTKAQYDDNVKKNKDAKNKVDKINATLENNKILIKKYTSDPLLKDIMDNFEMLDNIKIEKLNDDYTNCKGLRPELQNDYLVEQEKFKEFKVNYDFIKKDWKTAMDKVNKTYKEITNMQHEHQQMENQTPILENQINMLKNNNICIKNKTIK